MTLSTDPALCALKLHASMSLLLRRLRSDSAAADGPSVAKLSVLGLLHRLGPSTPTTLAAHEHVKLQSLTRLLAELEAEGWIGRAAHATDARQKLLSLTPEGTRRLQSHMRAREAVLARAIGSALDADQRALLLNACALLDDIAAALHDAGDGRP